MTSLRIAVERYLSMRQGLGYKYPNQAGRLRDFVTFMERRKATTITTKLAIAWATLPPRVGLAQGRRFDGAATNPSAAYSWASCRSEGTRHIEQVCAWGG